MGKMMYWLVLCTVTIVQLGSPVRADREMNQDSLLANHKDSRDDISIEDESTANTRPRTGRQLSQFRNQDQFGGSAGSLNQFGSTRTSDFNQGGTVGTAGTLGFSDQFGLSDQFGRRNNVGFTSQLGSSNNLGTTDQFVSTSQLLRNNLGLTSQPGSVNQLGALGRNGQFDSTNQFGLNQLRSSNQLGSPNQLRSANQHGSSSQLGSSSQRGSSSQLGSSNLLGSPSQLGSSNQLGSTNRFGSSNQLGSTNRLGSSDPFGTRNRFDTDEIFDGQIGRTPFSDNSLQNQQFGSRFGNGLGTSQLRNGLVNTQFNNADGFGSGFETNQFLNNNPGLGLRSGNRLLGSPSNFGSQVPTPEGLSRTLLYDASNDGLGQYDYQFATDNGITQQQASRLIGPNSRAVTGSYSSLGLIDRDGNPTGLQSTNFGNLGVNNRNFVSTSRIGDFGNTSGLRTGLQNTGFGNNGIQNLYNPNRLGSGNLFGTSLFSGLFPGGLNSGLLGFGTFNPDDISRQNFLSQSLRSGTSGLDFNTNSFNSLGANVLDTNIRPFNLLGTNGLNNFNNFPLNSFGTNGFNTNNLPIPPFGTNAFNNNNNFPIPPFGNNGFNFNNVPANSFGINGFIPNNNPFNSIGINGIAPNNLPSNSIGINGLTPNNLPFNSIGINGIASNNLPINSIGINGLTPNNLPLNSFGINGIAPNNLPLNSIGINGIATNNLPLNSFGINGFTPNNFPFNSVGINSFGQSQFPTNTLGTNPSIFTGTNLGGRPISPNSLLNSPRFLRSGLSRFLNNGLVDNDQLELRYRDANALANLGGGLLFDDNRNDVELFPRFERLTANTGSVFGNPFLQQQTGSNFGFRSRNPRRLDLTNVVNSRPVDIALASDRKSGISGNAASYSYRS
ncbi:probable cyclin-dependent serine/threonine-protein kinase DDB_G0292550 isoform X2 [Hyalella azteca]|uniref:Probable cyclin-dependent serine/threonine-protein kinase DDB_G0292550 isoform X2 n=1 Tax=Hyalella azteca TaxID=294128 RepID=A0A8B7NVD2_HYAAZ|nr:probable cyclin-dependent serine/threonine-protein kinase DDB_G0292550 isoform X2 [Hyalella azteca]